MNLIDVYIQEVTRRLPEKGRDDIALELWSTIEDMLPENYSDKGVKEVLKNLGNFFRECKARLVEHVVNEIYRLFIELITNTY